MLTLSIGSLSLPLERLLLLLSFAVAMLVGFLVGRKHKQSADGLLATILIVSMVIARLSFVLQYWSEYQGDLIAMLDIRDAGFDPWVGVITALLLIVRYAWRQPKVKKSLLYGTGAGLLVWTMTMSGLWLIRDTSQYLPQVMVTELSGDVVKLEQVESEKPRIINLWATWCPPCRREMPVLEQAQQESPEFGFVFVNQGEHEAVIAQFLQKESLNLNNVVADNKAMLGNLMGSRALPTTLFVDAEGRLVDAHLGELSRASLAAKLKKLDALRESDKEVNR